MNALAAPCVTKFSNAEWFTSIQQAQTVINMWLKEYNRIRPNQALDMRSPVPETLNQNGK